MQITPRRRAVIIGYQKLNMSFSAIAAAVNVSKSTDSKLYYDAVKNAAAANARAEPDALLAEINKKLEQLHLEAMEGEDVTAQCQVLK